MNYTQTLEYLYARLPMFTRIGAAAFKKDLTNTTRLCALLDHPEKQFKSIHVAGTNGKGSTSHMLASILQEAGYKTGLYTSPHLKDFRERIRMNGALIPEQQVVDFVQQYEPSFEAIEPSFFEWTVALAFHYFAQEKVDVAIIETGLGGRLDSTNVITPLLSVITNIGWDHMDMLGDTLEQIAYEKAGIIKPWVPAIIGETQNETTQVYLDKAKAIESPLHFADQTCKLSNFQLIADGIICDIDSIEFTADHVFCDLGGSYQEMNIRTVVTSVEELRKSGFDITDEAIIHGLARVKQNTGLAGRWQVLGKDPLIVCDTGHNTNGIELVTRQIAMQTFSRLHMVIGMVKDKDISNVLSLLPKEARYYFCNAAIPRALPASELAEAAARFDLKGVVIPDVKEALEEARRNAATDDMIFVGGSTFVVAEVV